MERFNDRIAALRKEQSLSQADVAARLGVSQGHYSKLEAGTRPASSELVDAIAALYQRSGPELVSGTDEAVRYAKSLTAPRRDELLRLHDDQERRSEREQIEATAILLRCTQQFYRELVSLFEVQHGGMLGIETDRALDIFAALKHCLLAEPTFLSWLEQQIGPIYVPQALFQKPVPPECAGEEYDYEMKPNLIDTQHRIDEYVAEFLTKHPEADRKLPNVPSVQIAIDDLEVFRRNEEKAFFDRVARTAKERGWLPASPPPGEPEGNDLNQDL